MQQKKKLSRKVISYVLALVMVFSTMTGIVPGMSLTAQAEGTDKTVAGLGTSAISNPTSTNSSASAWAGSYVYYGKYDGTNPTKYRVLDKASSDFGVSGGSLLLDCDTTLYNVAFDADAKANQGATKANEWVYSDLRSGLQGDAFWNKSDVFTEQEKDAIASSTKATAAQNDGSVNNQYISYAALSGDTVFVLDAKEASRASYGYVSNNTRKKNGTSSYGWWLRSPSSDGDRACIVRRSNGLIYYNSVDSALFGVSPAFNINLSSVIFASVITGTAGEAGAEYKLTLKDDNLGIALTSGQKVAQSENTLTIPYTVSGDNSANATQVSVLVTDKAYTDSNATILKYGKAADVTNTSLSGTANFTLPDGLTGTLGTDYHVYLLAEDVNGEKETDYANLKEITADDISTGPDKSALTDAITVAETLYNSIKDDTDYSTIASTLKTAIDAAKEVADSDTADQDAVDAATTAITDAKTNADAAKKDVDDTTEANKVSDKISDLPSKEAVTKNDKTAIDAAKAAFDELTDDQKAKVSDADKQKLNDAVEALAVIEKEEADTAAAKAVSDKISELPSKDEVTKDDKIAIDAAKAAFDALTDDQKEKVSDADKQKLNDAVEALAAIEKEEADTAAAKAVSDKISDLPSKEAVTKNDKTAIDAAKAAFDALTDDQKAKVSDADKQKLNDAVEALAAIEKEEADTAAAKAVSDKISELPSKDAVKKEDKTAIDAAKAAFDALTEDQKAKVSDADKQKLNDAVEALAAIEKEEADTAAAKAVGDKISELPSKEAVTKNDKEAIEAAKAAYDALTDDQKKKVSEEDKQKLNDAVAAIEAAFKFVDVPEDSFYYAPVCWALVQNPAITSGVDETHFKPMGICTRAQVVTFIWRANGCPEPTVTENPFTDISEDAFYYKAVLWAVEKGITAGKTATTFAPNDPCTRAQVVSFLWRDAGSPEPTLTESPFIDVTESNGYYKAVLWAAENHITNGINANEFGVKKTCIRAQIVTFIMNAYGTKE